MILTEKEIIKRKLKIELLRKLADHFEKELDKRRDMASSSFRVRGTNRPNCTENGSDIIIDVFHYGIENYYGKEIKDLFNKVSENMEDIR